ncbi:MAG: nicotinate-nucleotide adenylyltransferase [candidate division Zixibacteria bacterium]|nr:nicotinate-nucleotide adenylyltransferase [candidate division Zixibacteria bacterium]
MIKIGILGGIFDPVHNGHLHIADGILRKLDLSKVFMVPAGDPPHKEQSPYASGLHRLNMLNIAIAENPAFEILDIELNRPGKSFSVDTLRELKESYPDWELFFIIGSDNLSEILTWKNPERIFKLANIVLVNRPGNDLPPSEIDLPGEVIELKLPGLNISSTQIRQYIKDDVPCQYLLPPDVERYILDNSLYL